MDKHTDNCGNCYFNHDGECRFNPPTLTFTIENHNSTWDGEFQGMTAEWTPRFPPVNENEWCGQHKPEA